jgi:hypothetical protein
VATDDIPQTLCEYHLERTGVALRAARIVNNEPMCAQCFAGIAIFAFEKIGDTEGDVETGERRRRYLASNPEARARLRERKRIRNALWRARHREVTSEGACQQNASA